MQHDSGTLFHLHQNIQSLRAMTSVRPMLCNQSVGRTRIIFYAVLRNRASQYIRRTV